MINGVVKFDEARIRVRVSEARVMWDGKLRRVLVDEADTDPLVGMKLLKGYELRIQVRSRGKVIIERLQPR